MEEGDKILTIKVTAFKSLRINCWNITQVICTCKMFSSTLTSCYIQPLLPPPLMFPWECTNF